MWVGGVAFPHAGTSREVATVLVERFTGRNGWLVEPLMEAALEVLAVRDGPKLFPSELGTHSELSG